MDLTRVRNLGIAAHIDAGKTTVTERILFLSGVEHRVGQVDEGTAVMDWMAEERERGITITAAATRIPWGDTALNLIDTPGHVDFTVEVERCMRILDGAILVIDAVAGVQAQSETVWRQIQKNSIPCIAFVNKCDRVGADFLAATKSLRVRLNAPAVPIQYPIFEDERVVGVIDLVGRQAWRFDEEGARESTGIPSGLSDEIEVLRAELVETIANLDEELLQAVVDERGVSDELIRAALRRCTVASTLVPVLCGAALRGVGIQPLVDAVVDYLPSPLDRPPVRGFDAKGEATIERAPDPSESLSALAFKLHAGAHGDLTFVRVYSGTIKSGQKIWNTRAKKMERVARILRMHAEAGESLDEVGPGDIVALTGLKATGTGDTLCDRAEPVLLEPPRFPEPVIAIVAEPASAKDREKLGQALARIGHEDPSLRIKENEDTGQWLIEGMGELHLEVVVHRLNTDFQVEAQIGQQRVSFRESVRRAGRGRGKVDRVLGGKDVFGVVELELLPDPGVSSPEVEWDPDCPVPLPFRDSVAQGLRDEAQSGPRFGFPLVGGRILVTGGESSERRDSDVAFNQAASIALRQAMHAAEVALLEPLMAFEIQSPEEFASGIIADLGGRRAEVGDVVADGDLRTISGTVPLAQMFGYSTIVRSLSQGRASFVMTPAGFTEVPEEDLAARGLVWT